MAPDHLRAFSALSKEPTLMRMQLLWQHALTHLEDNAPLSAYYTRRMRQVAQQQHIALPKATLARFCDACGLIHIPGFNSDVRVRLTTHSRRSRVRIGARVKSKALVVVRSCWECGAATRQQCDAEVQPEPRGAQQGAGAAQAPAMGASRAGGSQVPPRSGSAQLDLFGLGSEFIAFSSS